MPLFVSFEVKRTKLAEDHKIYHTPSLLLVTWCLASKHVRESGIKTTNERWRNLIFLKLQNLIIGVWLRYDLISFISRVDTKTKGTSHCSKICRYAIWL